MVWKIFGTGGKSVSAKQRIFRIVRLIGRSRKGDSNVSLPTPVSTVDPYEPINSLTNYSLEAELKKAKALEYWRRMDRPK